MPYDITLENLPVGCAANSVKNAKDLEVVVRAFTSSEDGNKFINLVEGFPNELIEKAPADKKVLPSMIDHLVAIIRADKSATVYINELNIISKIRHKRPFKKGEAVLDKDIADIERVVLQGVSLPKDAGIAILFSKGWRKGYYFDFQPIWPFSPAPRAYDIEVLMGQIYGHLIFQHLFALDEKDWQNFFKQEWFPFITLDTKTIKKMILHAKEGWSIDDLLPEIAVEVKSMTNILLSRWNANPSFSGHMKVLEKALERYHSDDNISCTSILFPRIEGVLRSHHLIMASPRAMKQEDLSQSAIASIPTERRSSSLLLPAYFEKYMNEVYFRFFDRRNPQGVSRHTISHGVAPEADINLKSATIAILIMDQLAFTIR